MLVKLKIFKEAEPQAFHEHEFDKDSISIGRDIKNDLQLKGITSVVSRRHARLIRSGDTYKIIDLESRNFSFLNDEQLKGNVEYELKNGDSIRICDYIIQYSLEKHKEEYAAKTILDYPNPFIKDCLELAAVINRIDKTYSKEESSRKDDALQEAIQETLGKLKLDKTFNIIESTLLPQKKHEPIPPKKPALDLQSISDLDRLKKLMENLLKFFISMTHARRQFRLDFVGETMIKMKKSFSIYDCTVEELNDYLFSPDISMEESQKRIDKLNLLADELKLHQVSLLDGYKSSVEQGSKQILDKMDPLILKQQLNKNKLNLGVIKIPFRFVPFLNLIKSAQRFSEAHQELAQEDLSIIEKRYFRPGYIRSYNERMDSTRKKGDKA